MTAGSPLSVARPAVTSELVTHHVALCWAKIVRIAAATTVPADPLGTWARTTRRKCTRHHR